MLTPALTLTHTVMEAAWPRARCRVETKRARIEVVLMGWWSLFLPRQHFIAAQLKPAGSCVAHGIYLSDQLALKPVRGADYRTVRWLLAKCSRMPRQDPLVLSTGGYR